MEENALLEGPSACHKRGDLALELISVIFLSPK